MTPARTARPHGVATIESAVAALRARGLRISAARRRVLRRCSPPTAPATAGDRERTAAACPAGRRLALPQPRDARRRSGSWSTVHAGHGPGRYALTGRGADGWVDVRGCGGPCDSARRAAAHARGRPRRSGFDAAFGHFPVVGVCGGMRGASEERPALARPGALTPAEWRRARPGRRHRSRCTSIGCFAAARRRRAAGTTARRRPASSASASGSPPTRSGMRHAFDADHIAAIDNTTRKLMTDGQRPLSVGFWFSLGHSSVVFVLALLLSLGVRALAGAVAGRRLDPAQVDRRRRAPPSRASSCT